MRFRFSLLLACLAGDLAGATQWPEIAAAINGKFESLPEAPALHWSATLAPCERGTMQLKVLADGEGTRLEATMSMLPAEPGVMQWHLLKAEFDLARWSQAVAAHVPGLAGSVSSGRIWANGEGVFRDGNLLGKISIQLSEGRIELPSLKLVLEGLSCSLQFDDIATWHTPPSQVFTLSGGSYDTISLGAARVVFALADNMLRMDEAELDVFAGKLKHGAMTVSLTRPALAVKAHAESFDLALLLPYLPSALSEAKGYLDGELVFDCDVDGLRIASGLLSLKPETEALLRFRPSPGLLSGSLPPTVLKYYPGLIKVENGEAHVRADRLDVHIVPMGDIKGRSATVHLEGEPIDPSLKRRERLVLDFNVYGSLETLMKFGTDSRLRIGSGGIPER